MKVKSQDLGSKNISYTDLVAKLHNFASEFLGHFHMCTFPNVHPFRCTNLNSLCYFETVLNYKLNFVFRALRACITALPLGE